MDKKTILNFFLLIGKVIFPVFKVVVKLAKTAKVVKVTLIGGSFAAYAYMFSWKFALLILCFLFVHEYGHIWAMKRCGLKTKGIYFIPFLGAAAVTNEQFKSYKDEVYIALMGPVWGIVLALLSWSLYGITENTLFVGASIWMFLITLFNLLPIMPLDGGRVVRSIAMSLSSWGGVAVFIIGMAILLLLSKIIGAGLIVFFIIVGGLETFGEMIGRSVKKRDLRKKIEICITSDANLERLYIYFKEHLVIGDSNAVIHFEGAFFEYKMNQLPDEDMKKLFRIFTLRYSAERDLENLKNNPGGRSPMPAYDVLVSALSLVAVAGISLVLMYSFKHIPGADMALEVLSGK
ncbi:MAG: site-2 protease family protein [Deltaproteobacteria bacterium]|nr:MAG: site-2 protease family protein [Deltaproteobacteria bacterium]